MRISPRKDEGTKDTIGVEIARRGDPAAKRTSPLVPGNTILPLSRLRGASLWALLALVLWAFTAPAGAAEELVLREGFEEGFGLWEPFDGKQTLAATEARAHSGRFSAYSGPPGTMRVLRRTLPLPLVGRVQVWFFDDMAPAKQQMASVGGPGDELLGIVCRGGESYAVREGRTYLPTKVRRKPGWRLFAWECDGVRTTAFIDGAPVHIASRLGRIEVICLGSFWDASTGWYDALEVVAGEMAPAPVVQGEDACGRGGQGRERIVGIRAEGAIGRALRLAGAPGCWAEWILGGGGETGPHHLVLKCRASGRDTRALLGWFREGDRPVGVRLSPQAGLERDGWRYVAVPVPAGAGRARVRLWCEKGDLHLDWLALVPGASVDAPAYGAALDRVLRVGPLMERAALRLPAPTSVSEGDAVALLTAAIRRGPLPSGAAELDARLGEARSALDAGWRAALGDEKPKLQTIYRVPAGAAWGPETPLSRECYRRLLRYARTIRSRMQDWPLARGCRIHKADNSEELSVRQNATVALALAVMATLGDYRQEMSGMPRSEVRAGAVQLLRYLALTHAANFLPTGDGRPWGDHWQSAFWAGIAGQAAWLAWDLLDDETRLLVARMVEHEADRFLARPPDSGEWHDTKAEENAWNSEILALATCLFPEHPRAAAWHERALVYMMNSFSEAADHADERLVDGKPVKEWVTTTNVHADHTLENHNRVHPDYLATFTLCLRNALLYHRAGREVPQAAFHHAADAYAVCKRLTATNGSLFYVNGQDWWPHRHDVPLMAGGLMGVLAGDPEGAFLERTTLDWLGRMHSRFPDGRAWDRREFNYPNAEEELMARYAELYLLHRMAGDGPRPASRMAFLGAQSGVQVYEAGGFAIHRTPERFASFAWVNGAMGLVYPADDTWLIAPWERGLVGTIACEGVEDTTPKTTAHRVHTGFGGFAFVGTLERCKGKVEQGICMASLPEGPVLYLEVLRAREAINVRETATGAVALLNEDAPPISPNSRRVWHAGGRVHIPGTTAPPGGRPRAPADLVWDTGWANVEGRLGVVSTAGRMLYRDRDGYSRSRLQEELFAAYAKGIGAKRAGEEIGSVAVALFARQKPWEARQTRLECARFGAAGIAARCGEWIVAANPGAEAASGEAFGKRFALPPLGAVVQRQDGSGASGE